MLDPGILHCGLINCYSKKIKNSNHKYDVISCVLPDAAEVV